LGEILRSLVAPRNWTLALVVSLWWATELEVRVAGQVPGGKTRLASTIVVLEDCRRYRSTAHGHDSQLSRTASRP